MDIRTIIIMEIILVSFMFILIKTVYTIKAEIKGLNNWSYSYLFIFWGLIFLLLRGVAPNMISIVLGNFLLVLGLNQFYLGVKTNLEHKTNIWIHYMINIVYVVFMFYYSEINNILDYRIIGTSIMFCGYFILLAKESLNYLNPLKSIAFSIYLINSALEIIEIIYYFFNDPGGDFFSLEGISSLSIAFHLLIILLNMSIILTVVINDLISRLEKNIERERESSEKVNKLLKEKEKVFISISHDFRTPLNGILGMAELGEISKEVDKKDEYLRMIKNSSRHLNELVNMILADKLNIGEKEFSINELFQEIKNIFQGKCQYKELTFLCYSSQKIPNKLIGEFTKVKRVLFNLIENAIKYTETGGILVTAELTQKEGEVVRIKFQVKDTGIGIEKENLEKIQGLFYKKSEKRDSYGIGLYNAKKIIEDLDGELNIQSEINKGTSIDAILRFRAINNVVPQYKSSNEKIYILISRQKIVEEYFSKLMQDFGFEFCIFSSINEFNYLKQDIEGEKIVFSTVDIDEKNEEIVDLSKNPEKIMDFIPSVNKTKEEIDSVGSYNKFIGLTALIIEDSETSIKYLNDILEIINVKCDIAKTVSQAVDFVNNKKYNVIFSDYLIEDETGIDFLKKAKNYIPDETKKVLITANAQKEIEELAIEAGYDKFIKKPYLVEDIIGTINQFFANHKLDSLTRKLDRTKYKEIFKKDLVRNIPKLKEALQNENNQEVKKIIHTLKSGANIIGDEKIVELLETMDKENDKSRYKEVLEATFKLEELA